MFESWKTVKALGTVEYKTKFLFDAFSRKVLYSFLVHRGFEK